MRRRQRGVTLVETLCGTVVASLVSVATLSVLVTGIRSFNRSNTETVLANQNAQGVRRVTEAVRGAVAVTISTDGATLSYSLPARSTTVDPITGERELVEPLRSDGVIRSFIVDFNAGTLRDGQTGRVLVRNIARTDPERRSSQFGQSYRPFELTTVGSRRAITVNLITQQRMPDAVRYVRLKTSTVVRNAL